MLIKMYKVTVTPKVTVYASTYVGGQYTVDVYAKDSKAAVSKARQQRRDEDGRMAVPASYRASRIEA